MTISSKCQPKPRINATRCSYAGEDLSGADLSYANCSGVSFAGAKAVGTNFTGANLSHTDLTNADFTDATTTRWNIGGAIFCHTTMPDGSVNDANC